MKREYGGSNQLGILLLEALGFKDPLIIKKSLFNGLFPFKKKKKWSAHQIQSKNPNINFI